MNRRASTILKLGASAAALLATPAMAQTAPADASQSAAAETAPDTSATPPQDNGDIVVTARRRSETLQSVPIAVTAFSADKLDKIGAVDLTDIQNVTPNTTLKTARGSNSTLAAFIRGVGQQDPVPGFEAGIGIYLDDVYLNRPQAAVLDIYDVDRIEVLRGPQGTLYGRNTIGGAVKYVTKRLPNETELRVKANYGSYDQADGIVALSTPIGDMFKVGVAGARLSRGGFGRNTNLNIDNYNKDIWAGRGTIEFESPDTRLFVRITGDYTHDLSNPRNGHRLIPGLLSGAPVLANVFDTRAGLNFPKQDIQAGGLSMTANAQLTDHLTLRSISAWRKDTSFTPIDFDALPATDVDVPAIYRNEQTSQEFQLLYASDKLNGLVGYYYLGAKAATGFGVLLSTTVPGLDAYTAGDVRTETSSIYGDFTYDFTPQFSLSVGGRYTWDQRNAYVFKANYIGLTSEFGGTPVPFLGTPPATNFRGVANFKRFTPRVSLSFKPAPDHLLYASYSEGFKGGGFDPRGSGTSAPAATPGRPTYSEIYNYLLFKPETVTSYEAGYKGSAFDRRLTWALAGFYADYTDVQVPGSVGCLQNGVQSFCGITTNAARARIKGVELESTAILARDFAGVGSSVALNGTLGYIHARYRTFIGPTGVDVANVRVFQNTPDWTASGTLTGNVPLGDGLVTANSTVSYRSLTHQFETASPFLDQPGYTLLDAGLTYAFGEGRRYTIGVYGKNLTDVRYKTSGYRYIRSDIAGTPIPDAAGKPFPTLGKEGVATAFYGNPRQVFVSVGAKF
ncbi:TonB-dependent receptor [Arthrobacter sp. TPD3018]|uniref:TonB-dependent receptor n=1 Tax=Bacteria TaxID=2 RepID=UPI000D5077EB|nr:MULTISPECIES: TonB-dependent receptor [Bacteria]PVE51736.1 TonB-dependent receptor [Sphingomonas sp. TPD3009]PVE52541.1 TonB-dependent receptor [Arthrobacter sp. TPD3018]PVE80668.1 TonB-dependent receptor [Sphingomonas melonis]